MSQSVFSSPAVHGYVEVQDASYPPSTYRNSSASAALSMARDRGASYTTDEGFLRYDTSSLGAGVTITSATLTLSPSAISNTDSGAARFEYYDPGATLDISDFNNSLSATAANDVLVSAFSVGVDQVITLLNPDANISKTGFTGFRTGIVLAVTPTGNNEIHATTYTLTVNYTTPDSAIAKQCMFIGGAW